MAAYRRLTDNLIHWAAAVVAGVFLTVILAAFVPSLQFLLIAEGVATLIAAIILAGRWRLLTAWDALGFTSFRQCLLYQYGLRGYPWGIPVAALCALLIVQAVLGPLDAEQFFAAGGALAFSLSVGRASQRWPVDALEKGNER